MRTAIIGIGYVGLPLLLELSKKKIKAIGYDIDKKKILSLKNGVSYITDVSNRELRHVNKSFLFHNFNEKLSSCNYIIICLPTPLKGDEPDLSFITSAFKKIEPFLRKEQTLILESTVYPGATKEIFLKKLSKKFKVGKNFYLGFSPERINPGQNVNKESKIKIFDTTKIVSGFSKNCLKKVNIFYKNIFKSTYICETLEVAELTKLFENSFRSVNIGLVNELKMMCNKININFHNIISAASTKPFGFKRFDPGPGLGGHCIPIDPLFINWYAKKNNFNTKFIKLANQINKRTTEWVIEQIEKDISFKKYKILILGVSYKKNINDIRESPAVKIIKKLMKLDNVIVEYHDPYVESLILNKKKIKSKKLIYKGLSNYNSVLIVSNHDIYNYNKILKFSKKIFDTRGVYKDIKSNKISNI